jgi:hypothetical protein
MTEKRTGASDVERWNRAVREANTKTEVAPGAKEVLEASDEEIERQLLAAGVDLEAEDAKADATYDAMIAKLGQGEPRAPRAVTDDSADDVGDRGDAAWVAEAAPKNVVPMRRRRAVWLAYAVAAAAATSGAAYVAAHWGPPEEPKHDEPVVPPSVTVAPPAPVPPTAPRAPEPAKRGGGETGGR